MNTLERVLKPTLATYAKDLLVAGFRVWVFTSDIERVGKGGMPARASSIQFARDVDGRTCYGTVDLGFFEAPSFSMPIAPSKEHGSGMFVGKAADRDPLTVETAKLYASPTNWNYLVGTKQNYRDPMYERLYTEVSAHEVLCNQVGKYDCETDEMLDAMNDADEDLGDVEAPTGFLRRFVLNPTSPSEAAAAIHYATPYVVQITGNTGIVTTTTFPTLEAQMAWWAEAMTTYFTWAGIDDE